MDSISGTMATTANLKSTDPLKPEMLEADHRTRKLSQSEPQSRHLQLNEDLNDAGSKDHEEISSLHDYNVQTVNPGNSVDESKISLALELRALLTQGNAAKANIKMAEAIEKNLTLKGLISENDLTKCLTECLEHTIAELYTYREQPRFQELIKNLLKLGIDPKVALHKTFRYYTLMNVFIPLGVLDKNLQQYLEAAEDATNEKFRDFLKDHIFQEIYLALKKDRHLGLIDTERYLKLSDNIKIELDKRLLAFELEVCLLDAIHHKDFLAIFKISEMTKKRDIGLRIDSILVPDVKADLEKHLHVKLKTAMEKKEFSEIIQLIKMANNLKLNYKNDDLKQPMTNWLFASLDSSYLPRLLEIAETLDLNLNKLIPELKKQYPSIFFTHLQKYFEGSCIKEILNSWYQEIKSHEIDLHDNREALDSFIFNELFAHIRGNLKEYKETTSPSIDPRFHCFLYQDPYEQFLRNATLLEIDFNQPEIKDKIFDICRQMILKHYDHYVGSSSQFPLVVNVTQH